MDVGDLEKLKKRIIKKCFNGRKMMFLGINSFNILNKMFILIFGF